MDALDPEDGALVRDDTDSGEAQGLYVLRPFACEIDVLEPILHALNQDEQYPGTYSSYERSYTSSLEDYEQRESAFLSWEVEYGASVMGSAYTAPVHGAIRYLPELDGELTPWGPMLVTRSYMPGPAVFEEDSNQAFTQDYQLELYLERAPGEILHAYAMWRWVDFATWGTIEDEGIQRVVLNALADWDDDTQALCGGRG